MTQEADKVRAARWATLPTDVQVILAKHHKWVTEDDLSHEEVQENLGDAMAAFAQSEREAGYREGMNAAVQIVDIYSFEGNGWLNSPKVVVAALKARPLPPAPDPASKGNRADELPARDLGREYSNGRPRPKRY